MTGACLMLRHATQKKAVPKRGAGWTLNLGTRLDQ